MINGRSSRQERYGAFSYCKQHVNRVINYIRRQEEHHAKKSFGEEYRRLLREFDLSHDERYILRGIEYEGN